MIYLRHNVTLLSRCADDLGAGWSCYSALVKKVSFLTQCSHVALPVELQDVCTLFLGQLQAVMTLLSTVRRLFMLSLGLPVITASLFNADVPGIKPLAVSRGPMPAQLGKHPCPVTLVLRTATRRRYVTAAFSPLQPWFAVPAHACYWLRMNTPELQALHTPKPFERSS